MTNDANGGSGSPPAGFVPESDLIAAKKGLEAQIGELTAERDRFKGESVSAATKLSELNTLKVQAESKLAEYESQKTMIEEGQKKLEALTNGKQADSAKIAVLESKLRVSLVGMLTGQFGVAETVLKDKTVEQLEQLFEAAKLLPARGRFDGGGSAGGGGLRGSPMELARQAYERSK